MTKKKKGQFDHYKKWTTDEGYTFVAETKEDALIFIIILTKFFITYYGIIIEKELKSDLMFFAC